MPTSIPALGPILHLVGVCVNRIGTIHSPFFSIMQPWQVFVEWLSRPQSYWLWSLLGFLITGLTFYAAQLFRKTN